MNDDVVEVMGDYSPALVGATATFSCPSGQNLSGPNTTVCMESGRWMPDITEVQCIGELMLIRLVYEKFR